MSAIESGSLGPIKRGRVKKIALAIAGAATAAGLTAGAIYKGNSNEGSDMISAPVASGNIVPEVKGGAEKPQVQSVLPQEVAPVPPTASPTESPVAATSTPEAKKDVPCKVFPLEDCLKAELIERTNTTGSIRKAQILGFKLAPNTPIYAPDDGEISSGQGSDGSSLVSFSKPNDPKRTTLNIAGDISVEKKGRVSVSKGDLIGYSQESGLKLALGEGYTLAIGSSRFDENVLVDNPGLLQELFPEAFKIPAKRIHIQSTSASNTVLPPKFGN